MKRFWLFFLAFSLAGAVHASVTCSYEKTPELGVIADWDDYPAGYWAWSSAELKDTYSLKGRNYAIFTLWQRALHRDVVVICDAETQGWKILGTPNDDGFFTGLGSVRDPLGQTRTKSLIVGGRFDSISAIAVKADRTYALTATSPIAMGSFAMYREVALPFSWISPSWPETIWYEDSGPDDLEESEVSLDSRRGIKPVTLYGRTYLLIIEHRQSIDALRAKILLYDDETKENPFWRLIQLRDPEGRKIQAISILAPDELRVVESPDFKTATLTGSFRIMMDGKDPIASAVRFSGGALYWE